MTVDVLLGQLFAAGVVLSVEDERLLFDAPAGALTAELRAGIAAHRAELIRRLAPGTTAEIAAPPLEPQRTPCGGGEEGGAKGARKRIDFSRWVGRPDVSGRLGWESPDLPDESRWWARRTFEELPQWLPALPMPPARLTTTRKAGPPDE